MTDIFIKSFNRAYYLDRCLQSISRFVKGNYKVTVLDDGTPEEYLRKIQQLHPYITILKSEQYQKKQEAIKENLKSGQEINGFEIPTKLWVDAAKNASEFFLMTEDDVWFTKKNDLDGLVSGMKCNDVSLVKLGWLGNFNDDENMEISALDDKLNRTVPKKLFLGSRSLMEAFFFNRYKFFTILYKLGWVDNTTRRKYWSLNSILMGLYKKEYWLQIWKGMEGKVNEKRQLINAAVYYRKHQHQNFVARTKSEVMKTTFQSSATNSYHQYGDAFDVNLFNHEINEAWLKGDFDSLENFPNDFSMDYFEKFLSKKIDIEAFRSWTKNFKKHYKDLGCDVC